MSSSDNDGGSVAVSPKVNEWICDLLLLVVTKLTFDMA